jgi:hypothetical protein
MCAANTGVCASISVETITYAVFAGGDPLVHRLLAQVVRVQ